MKKILKWITILLTAFVVSFTTYIAYQYMQLQEKYKQDGNPRYRG